MESSLRHPELLRADAWAAKHVDLITACFERFQSDSEWPTLESLQHHFEVRGEDLDVTRLAWDMPRSLGFAEQGRLILLCRALLHIEAATPLLDAWFKAIQHAYNSWVEDPKSELVSHEIVDLVDGDTEMARLVGLVLLREGWMFGSGHGDPGGYWTREIIATVRVARSTHDFRALLEKRAEIEFPEPQAPETQGIPEQELEPPVATEAVPHVSRGRLRRFFSNPYTVVIIGGVAVLVIWASLSGGFNEVFGGGDSTTTKNSAIAEEQGIAGVKANSNEKSKSVREIAGEGGASSYADPHTLSEPGQSVAPGQTVKVTCRVYAPEPPSVNPDGYWYRLVSSPWNGQYYAPANSFWNGDIPGKKPYTHNTDFSVPPCSSAE